MAVSFPQINTYQSRFPSIDFSAIANLPNAFWQGQAVGRQNQLRKSVSEILANGGSWDDVIRQIGSVDPIAGAKLATDETTRFGLAPIWDDQGNAYQLSSGGGAQRIEGNFPPRMNYVQTPQGVYPMPVQGGQPGGVGPQFIDKDYLGPETEKAEGSKTGEAKVILPQAENAGRRLISSIDELTNDPYLPSMTGYRSYLPSITPDAKRVQSKVDQIGGQAFLATYDALRGAGQITEAEGAKAEAAISRLRTLGVDDPSYKQAAREAQYEVFELVNVARQKAGQAPVENPYAGGASSDGGGDGWTDLGNGIRIRQKQ